MKIIIGADPAGYTLKQAVIAKLSADEENTVKDMGCSYLPNGELIDPAGQHYPMIAEKVALEVGAGNFDFGILICGTGIGMSIAANKIPGVRAAHINNHYDARMSRLHNNANILCFGARVLAQEYALELVDIFLNAVPSEEERHIRRVNMISAIEKKYSKQ